MRLVINAPDGQEGHNGVKVTAVGVDGRFDLALNDGSVIGGCNPDVFQLFDDTGQPVAATVEPSAEEKIKVRLQAAESALLFLMDLSMGGML